MNWKEILCVHDWYIIKHGTAEEIRQGLKRDRRPYRSLAITGPRQFREKVCLKCEKYIDEITAEKEWQVNYEQQDETTVRYRKAKANAILEARIDWKRK